MQKDSFGYQNQGDNYQTYRPSYPQQIIDKIIVSTPVKDRYLDVATGTGQLLFRIAPFFKKSLGTDISQTMIKSASNKTSPDSNIQLIQTDCMNSLDAHGKFDLITVGEAIHWFPIPEFINFTAQKLISENGVFVVIGYYRKGLFSTDQQDLMTVYKQYFSTIEQCSKFDQKDLYEQYPEPKYNFRENFKSVEKELIDYKVTMETVDFVKYLKTYSFYNIYREKYPERQDPISVVEEKLKDREVVVLQTRYFIYTCSDVI